MTSLAGKTVLVTGATGFLGGQLVRLLAEQGATVRALARKVERAGYVKDVPNVEIVLGDITEPERLLPHAAGCDVVFHVAALIHGGWQEQRAVNVEGTRTVLEASAVGGVKRVVHISTVAVYGYNYPHDITEDHAPRPANEAYAVTKLEAEELVKDMAPRRGLEYSIIRPAYIYGPRSGAWTGQIFGLARQKTIFFPGTGAGAAHPVHVDDVCGLSMVAATHPRANGQIFNSAPDHAPTWREWLTHYRALTGQPLRWFPIPVAPLKPITHAAAAVAPSGSIVKTLPDLLPYTQRYFSYKMTKARDLLGWTNRIPLPDGIQGTADWLRAEGLL